MTINELKARKKELLARQKEELALQAEGRGDNLALFMVEEELLEVRAQLRALTPGKRIGSKGSRKASDYNLGRKQYWEWLEKDQDSSEEGVLDTHTIAQGVLAEARTLMTERQWEVFELWTHGLSCEKIGERLGVNASTVTRTLGRGKARMQELANMREIVKGDLSLDMSDPVALKAVLSCITETQLVYLYLYFGEFLSAREIEKLLSRDQSTISRTINRALDRIRQVFGVEDLTLRNMNVLGDVAYRFYLANSELEDPPPYWGRTILRETFHCEASRPLPPKARQRIHDYRIPDLRSDGAKPPEHLGPLVSALLGRVRRYQKYTKRETSPLQYWLQQIFHGLATRLKGNAR